MKTWGQGRGCFSRRCFPWGRGGVCFSRTKQAGASAIVTCFNVNLQKSGRNLCDVQLEWDVISQVQHFQEGRKFRSRCLC